jgi:uncharacterized protein YndB with AHSA1/START domain
VASAEDVVDAPAWLAPLTGLVALGTSLVLTGIYAYGTSLPEEHHATVRGELGASADEVWALLSDMEQRPKWRPQVDRIGKLKDENGKPSWRELDPGGDRFDFVVLEDEPPKLVLAVARPEDLGMTATWEFEVQPAGTGSVVTVTEHGALDNPFFRGWWWLRTGPYAGIEPDLRALAGALGSEVRIERVE